jgi:hypothetical protein
VVTRREPPEVSARALCITTKTTHQALLWENTRCRWQGLTSGTARHAVSGRSFDDLAREAEAGDATRWIASGFLQGKAFVGATVEENIRLTLLGPTDV